MGRDRFSERRDQIREEEELYRDLERMDSLGFSSDGAWERTLEEEVQRAAFADEDEKLELDPLTAQELDNDLANDSELPSASTQDKQEARSSADTVETREGSVDLNPNGLYAPKLTRKPSRQETIVGTPYLLSRCKGLVIVDRFSLLTNQIVRVQQLDPYGSILISTERDLPVLGRAKKEADCVNGVLFEYDSIKGREEHEYYKETSLTTDIMANEGLSREEARAKADKMESIYPSEPHTTTPGDYFEYNHHTVDLPRYTRRMRMVGGGIRHFVYLHGGDYCIGDYAGGYEWRKDKDKDKDKEGCTGGDTKQDTIYPESVRLAVRKNGQWVEKTMLPLLEVRSSKRPLVKFETPLTRLKNALDCLPQDMQEGDARDPSESIFKALDDAQEWRRNNLGVIDLLTHPLRPDVGVLRDGNYQCFRIDGEGNGTALLQREFGGVLLGINMGEQDTVAALLFEEIQRVEFHSLERGGLLGYYDLLPSSNHSTVSFAVECQISQSLTRALLTVQDGYGPNEMPDYGHILAFDLPQKLTETALQPSGILTFDSEINSKTRRGHDQLDLPLNCTASALDPSGRVFVACERAGDIEHVLHIFDLDPDKRDHSSDYYFGRYTSQPVNCRARLVGIGFDPHGDVFTVVHQPPPHLETSSNLTEEQKRKAVKEQQEKEAIDRIAPRYSLLFHSPSLSDRSRLRKDSTS